MRQNGPYLILPHVQVRPYGLLIYNRIEGPRYHQVEESREKKTPPQTYTGIISNYSRKRLKRAIQLMVASAQEKEALNFKTGKMFKFKVNFITLTLPAPQGHHSDKAIKQKCLDPWIKRMRRKYKLGSYVWRAERQRNGNLHFHIITDCYIRYDKIRDDWNSCLNALNFIDEFENKHGHRNPNSTDVHAVWKVKNLTQYFIKYMSKSSASEDKIEGKIWDCSSNLKIKENVEFELNGKIEDDVREVTLKDDVEVKITDFCTLIFIPQSQLEYYLPAVLRSAWISYLSRIRESHSP